MRRFTEFWICKFVAYAGMGDESVKSNPKEKIQSDKEEKLKILQTELNFYKKLVNDQNLLINELIGYLSNELID